MKKIYSLLVATAMVLGATSCQKDAAEEVAVNEPVSFTATLNATRTELGEGNKVMWNADDKIAIYTRENLVGTVFSGDATEAAATATFTTTETFAASETGYLAVYPELKWDTPNYPPTGVVPASTYADGVYSVPVHIGVEQDMVAGGWDEKYNYMVAYTTSDKLAFQAATALLKFTWTGQNDPMGGVTFTAEGANLAGDAVLNYNTADGSVSVTTTGTSTSITLFGLVSGETYYLPLFPGTISGFKFEAYNASWQLEEYLVHDTELEVKAGKIYNKVGAQTVASPWMFIGSSMTWDPQYQMTIDENGYHVAKNVNWFEGAFFYYYDMNEGELMKIASETVVAGQWQATAEMGMTGFDAPDGELFDVYLSEDASMMCVVAAGEAVPAMPSKYHIYVYNSSAWDVVNLYVWDDYGTNSNGVWPGTALTKTMVGEVEYYVYDIPNEYIGQNINFIINNGSAQTADLYTVVENDVYYFTNGTVVEDPANPVIPEVANTVLYLVPNSNWKVDNARFAAYFFGAGETWVDMTDEDGDGYYECVAPEGYPNVIFCRMNPSATDNIWDNKWNQTADLTVPTDGTNCYTVAEGAWDKGDGSWSTK